jgi:hypothetical protein
MPTTTLRQQTSLPLTWAQLDGNYVTVIRRNIQSQFTTYNGFGSDILYTNSNDGARFLDDTERFDNFRGRGAIAIGYNADQRSSGAQASLTEADNIAIGSEAISGGSSYSSSFIGIGFRAGRYAQSSYNTSNYGSIFIGAYTGYDYNNHAEGNICIGHQAGSLSLFSGGADYQQDHCIMIGLQTQAGNRQNTVDSSSNSINIGNSIQYFNMPTTQGKFAFGYTSWAPFSTLTHTVTVNGDVLASGDITAFSDETLKKDIKVIKNQLGVLDIIKGVQFNRKDNGKEDIGVIAQDVEKAFPELVCTTSDGIKGVTYNGLVGVLLSIIQELSADIDKMEEQWQ